MSPVGANPEERCPVDHKTREKWLEAARASGEQAPQVPYTIESREPPSPITVKQIRQRAEQVASNPSTFFETKHELEAITASMTDKQRSDLYQDFERYIRERGGIDKVRSSIREGGRYVRYDLDVGGWVPIAMKKIPAPRTPLSRTTTPRPSSRLPTDREISTIPRALHTNHDRNNMNPAEKAAAAPNNERDTGHDLESGNWIYPSQEMFFAAMKRKGHDPQTADMSSIVPIHNAVNERAWAEIKKWEAGRGSEACGGPKLVSFAGDSSKISPKARWNSYVMGYEAPFDRHDWVVDRCGKKVDYVIDFYSGKADEDRNRMPLSFYLDVRPKVNSWEGISTRVARAMGM